MGRFIARLAMMIVLLAGLGIGGLVGWTALDENADPEALLADVAVFLRSYTGLEIETPVPEDASEEDVGNAPSDVTDTEITGPVESAPPLAPRIAALLQSAEADDIDAMIDLAEAYARGLDVDPDVDTAIQWYTAAATRGSVDAQFILGEAYQTGRLGRRDTQEALVWLSAAAEEGDDRAALLMARAYLTGDGTTDNPLTAERWLLRAAEKENAAAAFELGRLYEGNLLGARDLGKAIEWYERARDLGSDEAVIALDRLAAGEETPQ